MSVIVHLSWLRQYKVYTLPLKEGLLSLKQAALYGSLKLTYVLRKEGPLVDPHNAFLTCFSLIFFINKLNV